jgi:hypothetical protein
MNEGDGVVGPRRPDPSQVSQLDNAPTVAGHRAALAVAAVNSKLKNRNNYYTCPLIRAPIVSLATQCCAGGKLVVPRVPAAGGGHAGTQGFHRVSEDGGTKGWTTSLTL